MTGGSECIYDVPSISFRSDFQLLLLQQLTYELLSRGVTGS